MDPSIKSTLVAANKDFVIKRFGEGSINKVTAHMNMGDAELISQNFMAAAWFPERVHANFLESVVEVLGKGDFTVCREMGIYSAHNTVPTIYKFFIRMGSPQFVLGKVNSFWRACHTHGRLERTVDKSKEGSTNLIDFPYPSRAFCESLAGYFAGTLELCGCKKISILHPRCRGKGDPVCEFPGTWE